MIKKKKAKQEAEQEQYVHFHKKFNSGADKEEKKSIIYQPLETNQHSFVFFKRYSSGLSEYYQILG